MQSHRRQEHVQAPRLLTQQSVGVALLHEAPHDPGSRRLGAGELLARIPVRLHQTMSALGSRLQVEEKGNLVARPSLPPGDLALGGLLLASLGLQLFRRRDTPELFAVLNLAVLAIYFGFSWRLLLPIYAIALPTLCHRPSTTLT